MQSAAASPNKIRKILKLFVYLDSFEFWFPGHYLLVVKKFNLFSLLELIPLEEIINLNVTWRPQVVKRYFTTGGSILENISKQEVFQHIEIAVVWFIVFSNILVCRRVMKWAVRALKGQGRNPWSTNAHPPSHPLTLKTVCVPHVHGNPSIYAYRFACSVVWSFSARKFS